MKDPLTNEEFEPKRNNQRFPNSKNRKKYHNIRANQLRKETAFVDKPLKINLRILKDIMLNRTDGTFHEEFLRGKGYNRQVYNSICKVENNTGYCVYNYILIFNKPYVNIIRNN